MKLRNALVFFLTLFLAFPAFAEDCGCQKEPIELAMNVGMMAGSSAAAACTTPAGDELSAGFTANTGWTAVTLVENTNLFYNHVLQAGDPTGSCGTGLNMQLTSTSNRERIYYNLGSTMDADVENVTIKFTIYFNSYSVSSGNELKLVGLGPTNEGAYNFVSLRNVTGTYYLRTTGAGTTTSAQIATGAWYTVTVYLDADTAAASYMKIDEVAACDAAGECAFARSATDCQYVVIGKNSVDANYADFEIGYLTIQTD